MASQPLTPLGIPLAGRSLDLTLLATVHAVDALGQSIIHSLRGSPSDHLLPKPGHATPVLFVLASATIMHAWVYSPSRLPRGYRDWIFRAADLDSRLLEALRQARYGKFFYGRDTGIASLCGSLCKDLGLPEEWGDPARTIPLPCQVYHMGYKSCEVHALWRFSNAVKFASKIYVPLQLLILARTWLTRKRLRSQDFRKAIVGAGRSSTFLGGFIALFYYGVCLARTRLGPKLFSRKTISPQMWDSGLCISAGGLLCGWSILAEDVKRRTDVMLFVLHRAVAVWFPRRYDRQKLWKEHLAFSLSAAVLFTTIQERPERVRGMLGKILRQVYQ
ncbi:hypothetical protein K402DRAFT_322740 [Aulographum hederae CBS 113979]|uniref:Integral membrane protein n=1 Tax=Aulographum hederae CBS 113979 TaxID=1176131 RepID=A0A6G1HDU6_9PEZI|nr:hypothetical protein K402DRAFT_322740 [Aulographum hederae CBS 113979]